MSGKHSRKRSRTSQLALVAIAVLALLAVAAAGGLYLHGRSQASAEKAAGATGSTTPASGVDSKRTQSSSSGAVSSPGAGSSTASANPSGASGGTTTSTQSPTTSTTAQKGYLTVAAGGDVLGDRQVGDFIDKKGGPAVFAGVRPYLEKADVAFANLECPVSTKGTAVKTKKYTFRGRPQLVDGLVSAGIDVMSLANNHSLDYGTAALLDTVSRLDQAGVAHAGAGANAKAAQAPAILDTPAGTVAVLAFTDIIPGGFAAGPKTAGVNPASPDRARVLASIKTAAAKADYVI